MGRAVNIFKNIYTFLFLKSSATDLTGPILLGIAPHWQSVFIQ
ncbi:hypothetical protein LBBP_01618 [Leptospira borgpetersenii serovar Ballum]|uniref:Uncharacterized protein n=1 Tax=Leptospira borgpetersenii serovar Ballum TaxID=280505 RepID=A0A0S2IRG1_LEPBO|nr:hypothetical protein LBBP_01618 [Leptospira borgpetersenii serovar Ballum]